MISETSGKAGNELAKQGAGWEANRRRGRSVVITLTTDSWRDSAGALYRPNSIARVELPSLPMPGSDMTISEVALSMGDAGTTCEITLMSPVAFTPQPFNVAQLLPFPELADIPSKP